MKTQDLAKGRLQEYKDHEEAGYLHWRYGREAYGATLLKLCSANYRGFESPYLRLRTPSSQDRLALVPQPRTQEKEEIMKKTVAAFALTVGLLLTAAPVAANAAPVADTSASQSVGSVVKTAGKNGNKPTNFQWWNPACYNFANVGNWSAPKYCWY